MTSSNFIHLHAYSEYSLDVGFFKIEDYIKLCYINGYESAVLTERANLFSAVKFYKKCLDFGVKPIIGCEVFLECYDNSYSRAILLCKNYLGYKSLISVLSKSYFNCSNDDIPILKYKWLASVSDNIIVIGLSVYSDIGKSLLNNNFEKAKEFSDFWKSTFKDKYYLSITRVGYCGENLYFNRLIDFFNLNKINLIATNEVSFLNKEDSLAYRSKIAMFDLQCKHFSNIFDDSIENKYFKSNVEMNALFSDIPNVLINTLELSTRCNLFFKFGCDYSPKIFKKEMLSINSYMYFFMFNKLILDNFFFTFFDFDIYLNRLKTELHIITTVGFSNYFLVTSDFICWAKNLDIFVGPGRGSGTGSLVAYLLSITGIDPLRNDLLFERFLNKERLSSPDFDVDFCIEGRDLVMDYIFDFYGIKKVAQIVTFGCMTLKSVIRDVGRVLGYSYFFLDKIIKALSNDVKISLASELVNNPKVRAEYDASYDVQVVLNLSLKIEGIIKNIGKHAGGLVIASVELLDYLPLQFDFFDSNLLTQLDKDDSEFLGFAKFDFLGLKTLTVFADVLESLCSYYSLKKNYFFFIDYFIFDDQRTYDLLDRGDTLGVFQFESYGIKSVLQKVSPYVFSDIVSLIALYRPGPLQSGLLLSFAKRKTGAEKIDYFHKKLIPILRETYGIIVYQEQVMLIAQIFSNYSLADSDLLRVVMSKKKTKGMETHLKNFCYGAELNGVDYYEAEDVFYLVEKFAGYGFNKAHSVGYGVLAYTASWFKANYNSIFLSSFLSSDMENIEDIDFYVNECSHFGITVLPPDVNRSFYCFTIVNANIMQAGFGIINGIGKSLIAEIIFSRSVYGFFNNFLDFLYRFDINLLTKKVIQALVYSGIFDKIHSSKFKLTLISNKFFDLYRRSNEHASSIVFSFLDNFFYTFIKKFYYILGYKNVEFFNNRAFLGKKIYINPLIFYINDFIAITKLSHISGVYVNRFFLGVVNNFYQLSDKFYNVVVSGLYDSRTIMFSIFRYKYNKDLIKPGKILVFAYFLKNKRLYELFIDDFYFFRNSFAKFLDIYFISSFLSDNFLNLFFNIIFNKSVKGSVLVRFFFFYYGELVCIKLPEKFKIYIHDDFINHLRRFKEVLDIKITYEI